METLVGRLRSVAVWEEKRRSRRRAIIACCSGALCIGILLFVVVYLYMNRSYVGYKVCQTMEIKNSAAMQYMAYNGGVLRYSRDGVTAMGTDGKDSWNGSYDMEHPTVDVCESSVVVADVGGKDLYIYTEKNKGQEMTMDYEILQASVSKQGVVAVLLEDTSSNMIYLYNPYASSDKLLAEIPTNVDEGYPVAMDLSSDGTSVVVSYVSVTSGTVESRVAFYNFTKVGENTNCLVGAKQYTDRVVSDIQYLNDTQVCLFSENGFSIWTNLKKPTETASQDFEQTIHSAFFSEKYVGVVTETSKESKGTLRVYSKKGKQVMKRQISTDYTEISMSGDEILLHGGDSCTVYRVNGVRKLQCDADEKLVGFLPAKGMNRYYLVEEGRIERIKPSTK